MTAILVDDEPNCLRLLEWALKTHCPQVKVLESFNDPEIAAHQIRLQKPDLVLLDVEMPQMNGFDLLASLDTIDFDVIFTTAYDKFALRAFKVSAVDYLLKPIDEAELMKAVAKVQEKRNQNRSFSQIQNLLEQIASPRPTSPDQIALPTAEGLEFTAPDDILYLQSDSNYTEIYLQDGRRLILSRTLKDVETLLPPDRFCRVHHSYIVNLRQIKRYVKGDGGYLIMKNGAEVRVSRSKKDVLLGRF
ncbi:MAG: LytTR family DNA-binding domain-containing protein [Bacteroidota bacterium]